MRLLHVVINHALVLSTLIINLTAPVCAKTKKLPPNPTQSISPRVITLWWILFNKPSECEFGYLDYGMVCSLEDVFVSYFNGNAIQLSILYGGGGITDDQGKLLLTSTVYKSNCALDLGELFVDPEAFFYSGRFGDIPVSGNATEPQSGYCPSEGEETEPHIIFRDHGPVADSPTDSLAQMTKLVSPLCSIEGGPNLCIGAGGCGIGPVTEDGVFVTDVENMQNFRKGCADRGECDAVEESLQLGGTGSKVVYIPTGDAIQAIVDIQIPDLPEGYFSD